MNGNLRTHLCYVTVALFYINTFPIVEKYFVQIRNYCFLRYLENSTS